MSLLKHKKVSKFGGDVYIDSITGPNPNMYGAFLLTRLSRLPDDPAAVVRRRSYVFVFRTYHDVFQIYLLWYGCCVL
jgi:hypothetical protein